MADPLRARMDDLPDFAKTQLHGPTSLGSKGQPNHHSHHHDQAQLMKALHLNEKSLEIAE